MFLKRILKFSPFIALTLLNLHALHAQEMTTTKPLSTARSGGGVSGGGGSHFEPLVDDIRADILKWISEGGAQALKLPDRLTYETYSGRMSQILQPKHVVVSFVTTEQEKASSDPEMKVVVEGRQKECRGFISNRDQRPNILCNSESFEKMTESARYRLVHHEYAGLAGVEQNVGAASDYEVSDQITDYLVLETRLRLAVKGKKANTEAKATTILGTYRLLTATNAGDAETGGGCPLTLFLYGDKDWVSIREQGKRYQSAETIYLKQGQITWFPGQHDPEKNEYSGDGCDGVRTESFDQRSSDISASLSFRTTYVSNPSCNPVIRKIRQNKSMGTNQVSLVLNKTTDVLTYVHITDRESDFDEDKMRVCIMQRE